MLKLKKATPVLMAILMLSPATNAFAVNNEVYEIPISINQENQEYVLENGSFDNSNGGIVLYNMEIEDGYHSGGYSDTFSLTSKNGEYVNFWIKNTGDHSIDIQINKGSSRTIKPGKSGHVYAEVGYFTSKYTFKAYPTTSGKIKFDYRIAQRDNQ